MMRGIPVVVGVVVAWLVIVTLPVRGAGQDLAQRPPIPIPFRLPRTIGAAELIDSAFVDGARRYMYQAPRTDNFDVYVWPLPDSVFGSPEEIRRHIAIQVSRYRETLPEGVLRNRYDDYRVAFDTTHPVTVNANMIDGHVVAAAISRGAVSYVSLFYIYAVGRMFVRIRLIVPAEDWDSNPVLDAPQALVRVLAYQVPEVRQ